MRVLCLHGMGTNAGIFEAQSEIFRGMLPKHFEYEFYDAEHEYPAAEGCADIFPGPYYCFYPIPTTNHVEAAHQYVQDIIDEEGPFDGVMGFSQGGALAASILLRHQKENPSAPAPFRFAIFIDASLPYWIDSTQGSDVAGLFLAASETGFGAPKPIAYQPYNDDGSGAAKPIAGRSTRKTVTSETEIADLLRGVNLAVMNEERFTRVPSEATDDDSDDDSDESPAIFSPQENLSGSCSPLSSADEEEDDYCGEAKSADLGGDYAVRRLHPSVDRFRIGIPTAHIYGSKDPYYRQSLELARLCEPQWTSTYEHPEGHIVPRDQGVNQKIAGTIERTLALVDCFL